MSRLCLATLIILLATLRTTAGCNFKRTFKETNPKNLEGIYCTPQLTNVEASNLVEQQFLGFYRKSQQENHICYYGKVNNDLVELSSLSGGKMYTAGNFSCPEYFDDVDGYCYVISATPSNYTDQLSGCNGLGGYLATVKSAAENASFVQFITDAEDDSFYIGLHNPTVSGGISGYRWLMDNSSVVFHNIADMNALKASKQCIVAWRTPPPNVGVGEWEESLCSVSRAAVCEANKILKPYQ